MEGVKIKKRNIKIIAFILVILIAWWLMNLYGNYIGEKSSDNIIEKEIKEEIEDQFSNVEEVHFTHMPITYKIDFSCSKEVLADFYINELNKENEWKTKLNEYDYYDEIVRAFSLIQNSTKGIVTFEQNQEIEKPDILILCDIYGRQRYSSITNKSMYEMTPEEQKLALERLQEFAGKVNAFNSGGIYNETFAYFEYSLYENKILTMNLTLYEPIENLQNCPFPSTKMKAILLLLGAKELPRENRYSKNIMYPGVSICPRSVNEMTIEQIEGIYSKQNL